MTRSECEVTVKKVLILILPVLVDTAQIVGALWDNRVTAVR